jgi:hypothetical protein
MVFAFLSLVRGVGRPAWLRWIPLPLLFHSGREVTIYIQTWVSIFLFHVRVEKWKESESICLIESSVISHTGLHFSTYVTEFLETQDISSVERNSTVHQSGKQLNQRGRDPNDEELSPLEDRTFSINM